MSGVEWIKLTTDMFDNRKIRQLRRLPEGNNIVLIWVMLLTLAGRCNTGGMIFLTENIPYDSKMLADELRFEESTVLLALEMLERFGMISRNPLLITNWEEYQNAEGLERIRAQTRERVAKCRERKALAKGENQQNEANVTPCNVTSNATVTQGNATEEDIENKNKNIEHLVFSDENTCRTDERRAILDAWNSVGLSQVKKIVAGTARQKMLDARIREYGAESVLSAIERVKQSAFLRGQNKNGWVATLDWLLKPNNFYKVLEGNYADHENRSTQQDRTGLQGTSTVDRLAKMIKEGVFDK